MSSRPDRRALVTGSAGFIGANLVERLLADGYSVLGIDNLSDYYDVSLKQARLDRIINHADYSHRYCNIENKPALLRLFDDYRPSVVIHLAAQPGVRHSITDPDIYVSTNVTGTLNVLEGCRNYPVRHLLMASSSSVYGSSIELPYREDQHASHPVSLYGATKKAAEVMAHSYSHLFRIPISALRFFTVFGPWGRPDMAPMLFADALHHDRIIRMYNNGLNRRSFTFIADIVDGIHALMNRPPSIATPPDKSNPIPGRSEWAPYQVLNIGGAESISTIEFVEMLEQVMGRKARLRLEPAQSGDVPATAADCSALERTTGALPCTTIKTGVGKFVAWYTAYQLDIRQPISSQSAAVAEADRR